MSDRKYKDHPFCQRLNDLLFSAHRFQGLTAKDIADDMGIMQQTLSFYKIGHCLPGTENLLKLADYFGVSTDYLLGREGYELEDDNEHTGTNQRTASGDQKRIP